MRILAIRGSNLTSLAGEFEVDLCAGALQGSGVFAITGPVGAGKTTLLDALCLALYNRTPRFNNTRGVFIGREDEDEKLRLRSNDVRSVLRRGSGSGHAEVDFEGLSGVVYRARWSVRRARGRADGAVQSQTISLEERDTKRVIGGTNTEVLEEIQTRIGLSFDQFCRSVLLAQGDFARFLKADERDRADLLERMTGTELYGRLSIAAFNRRKAIQMELLVLRQKLADRHVLAEEVRVRLESERADLQEKMARLDTELATADRAVRWHRELLRMQKAETDADEDLQRCSSRVVSHRRDGEASRTAFLIEIAKHDRVIAQALDRESQELDVVGQWLTENHRFETLAHHWDRWSSVLGRFRNSIEACRKLEKERSKADDAHERARSAFRRGEEECRRADAAHIVAEQERESAAAAVDDEDQSSLSERLADAERRLEGTRRADAAFNELQRAEQGVAALVEREKQAQASLALAQETARQGELELAPLQARREEAERALALAERVKSLEHHRADLESGEPCPLCGALEHPWADTSSEVETGLGSRVVELREAESVSRRSIAAAQGEAEAQTSLIEGIRREFESVRRQVATCRSGLPAEFADRDAVAVARASIVAERDAALADQKRIDQLRRVAKSAEKNAGDRRRDWITAKDKMVQCERAMHEAEAEQARIRTSREHQDEVRERVITELEDVFRAAEFGAIASWRVALERDPDGFVAKHERIALEYTRHEERRGELTARRDALSGLLVAVRGLSRGVDERSLEAVLAALHRVEFSSSASFAESLQREVRRLELHTDREAELAVRVANARAVLQDRRGTRESHAADDPPALTGGEAEQVKVRIESDLVAIRPSWDEVSFTLRRDDLVRKEVAELQPIIQAKIDSGRTWDQLNDLIGSFDGKVFRVYAQSLTLDRLLASANHHLQDLAPRYRLQRVPGYDLDLQIVDLDMGRDVRSVNSLSGGESFLVSLSLALGLSSVSAAATRVESLFIDEGFGNLDVQTLDSALATLDALQATGRQVGIISHVAGIAERIGAQVCIAPLGSGRSQVRTAVQM